MGFLIAVPIGAGAQFDGFIVGVVDLTAFVDVTVPPDQLPGYAFALSDGSTVRYCHCPEGERPPAGAGAESTLQLAGLTLRVHAWPTSSATMISPALPLIVLAIGALLASLLGGSAALARVAAERAGEAERQIAERERVQEALRASEARHRSISELTSDYVYALRMEPDGAVRNEWVTDAFATVTGYTPAELEAAGGYRALLVAEDQAITSARAERIFSGQTDASEFRIRTKVGELRWVRDYARPVCDAEGRVVQIIGAVRDITAQRQAEAALQASEARYRSMITTLSEGVTLNGSDGTLQACNASAERILGLTRDQLMGQASLDPAWRTIREDGSLFPPEEHPAMVALRTGWPQQHVVMGIHKPDGSLTWISVNAFPLGPHDGAEAVVTSFTDITESRALEAKGVALLITDWQMPRLSGPELIQRIRGSALPSYIYTVLLTARDSKTDTVTGLDCGADDYLTKPFHPDELRARVAIGARILALETSLREARDGFAYQASHDPLTGLFNRLAITNHVRAELSRASRGSYPLSLALLDIDHFKTINDTHGHLVGDQALWHVAHILSEGIRPYDWVGRWGGEEFLVVLSSTAGEEAVAVAERLRVQLATRPLPLPNGSDLTLTASFGIASTEQWAEQDNDPVQLFQRADAALYAAKAAGRNRVHWDPANWI